MYVINFLCTATVDCRSGNQRSKFIFLQMKPCIHTVLKNEVILMIDGTDKSLYGIVIKYFYIKLDIFNLSNTFHIFILTQILLKLYFYAFGLCRHILYYNVKILR